MKMIKQTAVFKAWMNGLKDRQALARIRIRLDRLAMGNPGQSRNLKAGVAELKIDFGPGYRVYYTEHKGEIIILLCGGTKKDQSADIALAEKMAKEL